MKIINNVFPPHFAILGPFVFKKENSLKALSPVLLFLSFCNIEEGLSDWLCNLSCIISA